MGRCSVSGQRGGGARAWYGAGGVVHACPRTDRRRWSADGRPPSATSRTCNIGPAGPTRIAATAHLGIPVTEHRPFRLGPLDTGNFGRLYQPSRHAASVAGSARMIRAMFCSGLFRTSQQVRREAACTSSIERRRAARWLSLISPRWSTCRCTTRATWPPGRSVRPAASARPGRTRMNGRCCSRRTGSWFCARLG